MVTDSKTHTFTTLSNKFKLIIAYIIRKLTCVEIFFLAK